MNRLFLCILIVVFATSAFVRAQDYAIAGIEPSATDTPKYNFSLAANKRTPRAQKWLEVEVKFAAKPAFTDELTLRYFVLFGDKLLVGEVTHVNIPAGRELYSIMYLTPKTISRLLGGGSFSPSVIKNIAVQILNKGQLVAQESWKPAGNPNWFQNMQQIQGMLRNKNETPFAPLYWDRYEEIKPAR